MPWQNNESVIEPKSKKLYKQLAELWNMLFPTYQQQDDPNYDVSDLKARYSARQARTLAWLFQRLEEEKDEKTAGQLNQSPLDGDRFQELQANPVSRILRDHNLVSCEYFAY